MTLAKFPKASLSVSGLVGGDSPNPSSSPGMEQQTFPHLSLSSPLREITPALEAPGTNSRLVNLNDFKGQLVLVSFWTSWCGPCRKEMPELLDFVSQWNRNSKRTFDLVWLAVDVQEDFLSIREIVTDERYQGTRFLFDTKGINADRWEAKAFPDALRDCSGWKKSSTAGRDIQKVYEFGSGKHWTASRILNPSSLTWPGVCPLSPKDWERISSKASFRGKKPRWTI